MGRPRQGGPSPWEEPPREEYPSDGFSLCSSRARAIIQWSQRPLKYSEVPRRPCPIRTPRNPETANRLKPLRIFSLAPSFITTKNGSSSDVGRCIPCVVPPPNSFGPLAIRRASKIVFNRLSTSCRASQAPRIGMPGQRSPKADRCVSHKPTGHHRDACNLGLVNRGRIARIASVTAAESPTRRSLSDSTNKFSGRGVRLNLSHFLRFGRNVRLSAALT